MAKKKDPYEGAEEHGTTLMDFIIPEKVRAFADAYNPCADEKMATKWFDDARLRAFFKAYVCSLGDPLNIYLEMLEPYGFRMKVGAMDEPVIFVTENVEEEGNILDKLP